MKKLFTMMALAVLGLFLTACTSNDDNEELKLANLTVSVIGVDDVKGFEVTLINKTTNSNYKATTDAAGDVHFQVTPGIYQASVSVTRYQDGYRYVFNGLSSEITLTANQESTATIELKAAKTSQIIIKELYNGGCPKDPSGYFANDKCLILYNNSAEPATLNNLCIAFASPYNAHANNKNYEDGKLTYDGEGFIPAFGGMWWFQEEITIAPYSQVVVNVSGAIDNTQTYPNSINYANADYYCMYDPESGFSNTSWYPTPAAVIPTSHYLKAKKLGSANSWPLSNSSPALFVFQTQGITPAAFAEDADNLWYDGGTVSDINAAIKVPNEWIIDAIEVYQTAKINDSKKRFTSDIDAGYVGLTNQLGHVLYRNVDKEATKALSENAGKLVYNYTLGVDDSTDPNGIDAEASIKNGAHIIFKDTNNSTNDFHERQKCSLKD